MKRLPLLASALLGALWLTACGDDDDNSSNSLVPPDAGSEESSSSESDPSSDAPTETTPPITEPSMEPGSETTDDPETDGETDTATDSTDTDDTSTDPTDPDGGVPDEPLPEGFIGIGGGTITTDDGVVLVVLPNSIDPAGVITVDPVAAPSLVGLDLVSAVWDLGPDGTLFSPAATLTLPYFAAAAGESEVAIFWFDETNEEWVALSDCNTANDAVTCPIEHFTTVAVGTVTNNGAGGSGGSSAGGSSAGGAGGSSAGGAGGSSAGGAGGSSTGGVGGEAAGGGGSSSGGTGGVSAGGTGGVSAGGTGGQSVGGTGGQSVGGGGAGGSGGQSVGGTGSGGAGSGTCYVPCWDEIDFASCQPGALETCQFNPAPPAIPTSMNLCYDNDVKVQFTGILAEPIVMSFKDPVGAACYSLEITGAQTTTYHYTWKAPGSGATVMTATVESSNPDVVTYQCDGTEYVIDHASPECPDDSQPADPGASCSAQGQVCTF